ncbi:unnamed protein product, partial [Rotaria socialis]
MISIREFNIAFYFYLSDWELAWLYRTHCNANEILFSSAFR